jgi:peptide-methionine (S)-S-oxide reductase
MKNGILFLSLLFSVVGSLSCTSPAGAGEKVSTDSIPKTPVSVENNKEVITLGAGCFWCVETIFQNLKGVEKVVSGYSGGHVKNPAYKEVSNGTTGHAEVAQITFDPAVVSLEEVLEVFFLTHDPTTLNRQGNDVGTQYRSAIFYHTDGQRQTAEEIIKKLNAAKAWENPIVTEVTRFTNFYPAEDYHQNYFNLNSEQPYCQYVIRPKLDKFKKVFKEKVK